MSDFSVETWPEPPLAGSEAAAVVGALERQRATLAWKCSGLDAAGLRATVGASTVTLGGLLKHLAHVEDSHFARLWLDTVPGPPWSTVDWETDPDWDHRSAAQDTPEELRALWEGAVRRSRAVVDTALVTGGLDQLGAYVTRGGDRPNLRRILLDPGPVVWVRLGSRAPARTSAALSSLTNAPHCLPPPPCSCTHRTPLPDPARPKRQALVEEYARHVGHADLIRESVDGLTGEDPPR